MGLSNWVISKVPTAIFPFFPDEGTYNLLTKSHDPSSTVIIMGSIEDNVGALIIRIG